MDKRALITGITGFVGSHLAEFLLSQGYDVAGTIRWRSDTKNIEHVRDKIRLIECDIRDSYSFKKALNQVEPHEVYHLAAQSFVPTSWHAPQETLTTNIIGAVNLFEGIRLANIDPKVQFAGSSEEYGLVHEHEMPVTEEQPLRPLSPYAVSKVAGDRLSFQYHRSYGMKIVITRAFNHSVSKWTPVMVKDNLTGFVDIKYISEIRQKQKEGGYLSGIKINDIQLWDMSRHNLSVWSDAGWQQIKTISCHPIRNHKLIKIATRQSVFDVTDNHSILDASGSPTSAGNSKEGDRLLQSALPETNITDMPHELAWLYGFFAAEGCITGGRIRVDNKDKKLLERCEQIIKKYICKGCYRTEGKGATRLVIRKSHKLAKQWHPEFYASDGNKKIPKIILNANKKVKLSFLKGYNDGDGLKAGHRSREEFKNFKTRSPILAMGLCFLTENTTKQRYTINIEERNGVFYYSINLNSRGRGTLEGRHLRKPSDEIIKKITIPYHDEVWDFETENHHFHCGIGRGVVHNSGPRRGQVFVDSNFAKQVAEIEKGKRHFLLHGNLDARRDFSDVRDIVRAYWLSLQKCNYGEPYNICSEKARSIQEMLQLLVSMASCRIETRPDPERMRPSDVLVLLGNSTKFRQATGWSPQIPYEQTLKDMLDYWRNMT